LTKKEKVKRYPAIILKAILATSIIFASGCGSKESYSKDQVLNSFSKVAEQRTLIGRDNIYPWWSEKISQGSIKYVKDGDYYEIEFLGMSGGSEVWGIDMGSSKIWPINNSAVLMAFALFCHSGEDPSADCQQWAHQMEAAK
jgi:hypothetical protein